jgi:hypothetical protein
MLRHTGIGNALVWAGTSTAALNLLNVASVPEGRGITVHNAGTGTHTVTAYGADLVNGPSTRVLARKEAVEIMRVGAAYAGFWKGDHRVGELIQSGMSTSPQSCRKSSITPSSRPCRLGILAFRNCTTFSSKEKHLAGFQV